MLIETFLTEHKNDVFKADIVEFFGLVYIDLYKNDVFVRRYDIAEKRNSSFIESYAQNILKVEISKS